MALPSRETPAAEPASSDYLSCIAPAGVASARIHLDVVDAISADVISGFSALRRRGVEVGGILLGRREGQSVSIESFERVTCEYRFGPSYILSAADANAFDQACANFKSDPKLAILGYYRSHTRPNLQLEPSDVTVIDRWFSAADSLFLIVKPLDLTHIMAEFFTRQNGKLPMKSADREFPFQGRGVGVFYPVEPEEFATREETASVEEPTPPEEVAIVEAPPEQTAEPVVNIQRKNIPPPVVPATRQRQMRPQKELFTQYRERGFVARHWEALAALVLVAGAAGLYFWQNSGGDEESALQPAAPVSQTAAQPVSQPVSQPASQPASLGLEVQPDAGAWHVVWKSEQPFIQNALRGLLTIEDGGSRKEVPLTPEQLRAGSVPYRHVGDDVTFRLRVFGPGDQSSMELFRVLLANKPGAVKPAAAPPVQTAAVESKPVVPAPAAKTVARGETAHHLVAAEVLQRVRPEITEGIRSRITEDTVVLVKVNIDSNGTVTSAVPITHGDGLISYLGKRASEAARRWRFEPAKDNGALVASSQVIRFVFER